MSGWKDVWERTSGGKQDAAAQYDDADDPYTDDDIRSYSDEDWESCSSDSSLSSEILIHLLRRAEIFHHGRRIKTKREANETLLDGVSNECAAKNALELVQEEEREKQRAEKRKAKKKKRKEKKKEKQLELNTKEIDSSKNNKSKNSNTTKQKKKGQAGSSQELDKQSEEEVTCEGDSNPTEEDDDFLDLNSAFVTNAASKNKQKPANKSRPKKIAVNNVEDSTIKESENLAMQGYLAAKQQKYVEAVNYFTKAINLIKNDYRFYSNRSFCYCQLGQYMNGLKDADLAIQYLPDSPKAYFRRGEALKHLKRYKEAEAAFRKTLELDDSIEEAWQELKHLKVQQLVDMGFELHDSQAAMQEHCSVQAAVEALSIAKNELDEDEIFYSDDEGESSSVAASNGVAHSLNPLGITSLWVGNITKEVTEAQLHELFGRYGEIASIKLLPQSFCAFINYKLKTSAGPAMRDLQGTFLGGQYITIRFPNNAASSLEQKAIITSSAKQVKPSGPVNSNECHFWRTTGCVYGDSCRYLHIEEHKGIDKKPWQKVTEP